MWLAVPACVVLLERAEANLTSGALLLLLLYAAAMAGVLTGRVMTNAGHVCDVRLVVCVCFCLVNTRRFTFLLISGGGRYM